MAQFKNDEMQSLTLNLLKLGTTYRGNRDSALLRRGFALLRTSLKYKIRNPGLLQFKEDLYIILKWRYAILCIERSICVAKRLI